MTLSTEKNKKLSAIATVNQENRAAWISSPAENEQNLISEYSIEEFLGEGGSGIVNLRISQKTQKKYAIKEIEITDDRSRTNAEEETSLLSEAAHENVVRLYASWFEDNWFFMKMEYCPNGTIQNLIKNRTYQDPLELWNSFNQLIEAVEHCHENKIAHGDLQSQNILLDDQDNLKISDFGNAQRLKTEYRPDLGTIFYNFLSEYMMKKDIGDIGMMLLDMFYGPFETDKDRMKALEKITRESPSASESTRDNIPEPEDLIKILVNEKCETLLKDHAQNKILFEIQQQIELFGLVLILICFVMIIVLIATLVVIKKAILGIKHVLILAYEPFVQLMERRLRISAYLGIVKLVQRIIPPDKTSTSF